MSQHTPGPWWWEDWDQDNGPRTRSLVARPETKPNFKQSMFPDIPNRILCDEDGDCTEANKALIAAAPDLLAALGQITASDCLADDTLTNSDLRNVISELQGIAAAAIAKATKD